MAASTINRPDRALTVETILKASRPEPAEPARATPSGWMAALRVGVGSVFLWAFLDKLFGLGYSTPSERSWLNGGSPTRSEEHTSELQSLMRISYAVFCWTKKKTRNTT